MQQGDIINETEKWKREGRKMRNSLKLVAIRHAKENIYINKSTG